MPYKILWDNGNEACGAFPTVYQNEVDAEQAAEDIYAENLAQDVWDDTASVEVIEVDEPLTEDEVEELAAAAEQMLDYFNRYIAGDR